MAEPVALAALAAADVGIAMGGGADVALETADAAALCIRSGNAAILRCGSDCLQSSLAVHAAMVEGLTAAGLPADAVQALGVVLGGFIGWALVRTLAKWGLGAPVMPWGLMAITLVAAAVVGVLAALWPAVRAARTKPLEAIADL